MGIFSISLREAQRSFSKSSKDGSITIIMIRRDCTSFSSTSCCLFAQSLESRVYGRWTFGVIVHFCDTVFTCLIGECDLYSCQRGPRVRVSKGGRGTYLCDHRSAQEGSEVCCGAFEICEVVPGKISGLFIYARPGRTVLTII
jgi:hypothetical protein